MPPLQPPYAVSFRARLICRSEEIGKLEGRTFIYLLLDSYCNKYRTQNKLVVLELPITQLNVGEIKKINY